MNICVACRREMVCDKNGVAVRFREDGSHVYMGDRFVCPECGTEIIVTNPDSMFDPEAKRETPDDVWMDNPKRGYRPPPLTQKQINNLKFDRGLCNCDGSLHNLGMGCN